MNNKFKLKYSSIFYNDIDSIITYVKNELDNIVAANNLLNKVEKEINNRLQNPLNHEKYKTKSGNIYYRIYINNYIVFYTITDNIMEVRRFLYSKRDINSFL